MKRIIAFATITIAIVALLVVNQTALFAGSSATSTDTMSTANQLYDAGQFVQAANAYQQLTDQGFEDSALYFNLGNAYFKQGDVGRAILNYRRAETLAPRDGDIAANLAFARARTIDQLEPADPTFWAHIAGLSSKWLTLNELAILSLGLWFALAIIIALYAARRKSGWLRDAMQVALVVVALLLTISVVGLGSRMALERSNPPGVILADEIAVTSGPGEQYVTGFTLHSGAEVTLHDSASLNTGDWVRLSLPGGELQGWVPAEAVSAVGG